MTLPGEGEPASPPEPPARKQSYFPAIDGLRAVACLSVLFYHAWLRAGGYEWPALQLGPLRLSYPDDCLANGFLGIDVFFILSAFCLAYPILRRAEKPFVWKEYLKRRAKRIGPPYYCAMGLFIVLSMLVSRCHIEPFYSDQLMVVEPLRQTLYGLLFIQPVYNSSFWTLCVEARWYLVLPFFVTLQKRHGSLALMSLCVVLSAIFYPISRRWMEPGFFGRLNLILSPGGVYLVTFGLGIVVAAAVQNAKAAPSAALARYARFGLLFSVILIEVWKPYRSGEIARLLCGALLAISLLLVALYDPIFRKMLSWRPLVFIGVASFSIYLLHEPLISMVYACTEPRHLSQPVQFFVYQCVMVPLLISVGLLFFFLIERPFSIQVRKGIK